MKIQIRTTTDSLDPNATCTPEQAEQALARYCAEIDREVARIYPDAEVQHLAEDYCDRASAIRVTGVPVNEDRDEQAEIENRIHRICEDVFETGNFWTGNDPRPPR